MFVQWHNFVQACDVVDVTNVPGRLNIELVVRKIHIMF